MTALFFWLVVGHCLADYPLQGQFLALAKRRSSIGSTPWQIALFAHSMIHAGFVAAITGSVYLGLAELVAHMIIDYAKCEGWMMPFGHSQQAERDAFWADQLLHIGCKVIWMALA